MANNISLQQSALDQVSTPGQGDAIGAYLLTLMVRFPMLGIQV